MRNKGGKMKILTKMEGGPFKYVLVELCDKTSHKKVEKLLEKRLYGDAITEVLSRGESKGGFDDPREGEHKADMILTPSSVHWDLT